METFTQAAMPLDIATAVEEITKGHKQMSLLRALVTVPQPGGAWPEKAEVLFDGVMRSLALALSTLNPLAERISHRHPEATWLGDRSSANNNWREERPTRKRKGTQTKNKNDLSRKRTLTLLPMYDAYQWRKYGEKKIHGTHFPRCYYRCAYREDEGCRAMKQVQQTNDGDPPLFIVTSIGRHTCTMAQIVSKPGFSIVAADSSSSSELGSYYFGVRQGSCVPSPSPFTEEKLELDMVDEGRGGCSPAGQPARPDQEGCERAEVTDKEFFCNGASDVPDMISSMLCPMSPYSMHLEMTVDSLASGSYDDLWLF